jgi:hypothetical protein
VCGKPAYFNTSEIIIIFVSRLPLFFSCCCHVFWWNKVVYIMLTSKPRYRQNQLRLLFCHFSILHFLWWLQNACLCSCDWFKRLFETLQVLTSWCIVVHCGTWLLHAREPYVKTWPLHLTWIVREALVFILGCHSLFQFTVLCSFHLQRWLSF